MKTSLTCWAWHDPICMSAFTGRRPPPCSYCKAADEKTPATDPSAGRRTATYGYRRVTALVNRVLAAESQPGPNYKRVFRIMKRHDLLLQRHTGRRKGRLHGGKVVVMRSNLRWCCDVFEITCWNGEIVRIVFVIDAHDRGSARLACGGQRRRRGSMVRDLMLEAVELRFVTIQAPHAVERLSDNGSPFTAKETLDFAAALGLVPCFTPVHSPESNGIAEAFVKTFKRDYARIHPLPDAATVLRQIARWFDYYNESHPYSGLGMISPREFIRSSHAAGCPVKRGNTRIFAKPFSQSLSSTALRW